MAEPINVTTAQAPGVALQVGTNGVETITIGYDEKGRYAWIAMRGKLNGKPVEGMYYVPIAALMATVETWPEGKPVVEIVRGDVS